MQFIQKANTKVHIELITQLLGNRVFVFSFDYE